MRRCGWSTARGKRSTLACWTTCHTGSGTIADCAPLLTRWKDVAAACGYAFVNADVSHGEFYCGPGGIAYQPEQVARVVAAWGGVAWEAGPAEAEVYFPQAIPEFIMLFDRGAFQDLEEVEE